MDLAGARPLDGLVAYYALHDQPRALLAGTVAAWHRVIRPAVAGSRRGWSRNGRPRWSSSARRPHGWRIQAAVQEAAP
jgi:hypothetical protein